MGAAKRHDAVGKAMTAAIGAQGEIPSRHVRAVMLSPRDTATRFEATDRAEFRTDLWTLVAETHHQWPTERMLPADADRAWQFDSVERAIRSVHAKTWANWV